MAEIDPEKIFKWSKFFGGLVNPLNTAKSIVFMIQGAVVIILIMCVAFTGFWLKSKLAKKPTVAPISVMNNSGTVHSSVDEIKKKYGLVNIF